MRAASVAKPESRKTALRIAEIRERYRWSAFTSACYCACMVALQIRDVPDDVRDVLAREARASGKSLQSFLLEVLEREARSARNRAFVTDFVAIPGTGSAIAVDIPSLIEQERDARDARILGAASSPLT